MIAYTLTNNSITVVLKNKVYTVNNGQPQWNQVLDAIRNNDEKQLANVLSIASSIASFTEGNVTVKDNLVLYRDKELDNYVVEKVLEFARNKLPLQPILRFINNLMKNPSRRAVQELYKFLEHKNMPITPDGNFLAYKGVQADYYSKTAGSIVVIKGKVQDGKIYNGIGEEIEVERNSVCDDKMQGCSAGLHAGSVAYATDFGKGGRVVLVEINPADVVSVPEDCSCQKLRTCKYKVVGEYEVPLNDNYHNAFGKEDWNDDCEEDFGEDSDEESFFEEEQCRCPFCEEQENIEELFHNETIKTEKDAINEAFDKAFPSLKNSGVKVEKPDVKAELEKLLASVEADVKNKFVDTATALREFAEKINATAPANVPTPVEQAKKTVQSALEVLRDALDDRLKKK